MLKVSQSIRRKRGGVTGLALPGRAVTGLSGGTPWLSPPWPAAGNGLFGAGFFGGLFGLILGIWFYQKMKEELLKSERHLSIQKWLRLAACYGRSGWRPRNRGQSPNC